MNTKITQPGNTAETKGGMLAALKANMEQRLYELLERSLVEIAPRLGACRVRPFGEAKGQLTEVFRNVRSGTIEGIQNTKSGELVLVIDPVMLGQLVEALHRPATLADAFSDLAPVDEPLPADRAVRGEDPFSLERRVALAEPAGS